jgi:hypothetical protein
MANLPCEWLDVSRIGLSQSDAWNIAGKSAT